MKSLLQFPALILLFLALAASIVLGVMFLAAILASAWLFEVLAELTPVKEAS